MFLHRLSDTELRADCKAAIEALKIWLRRLIDLTLSSNFGNDYIHAQDAPTGNFLLRKALRGSIQQRAASDPKRYPRDIDAALLDDEIYIICHGKLYDRFFRPVFASHFPFGREELRVFLERLIEPRNALAHSNPLSIRQAEQVICYSHDVIDAIKRHMETINMAKNYNAPTIIKLIDSRGLAFHESEITRNLTGRGLVNLAEDGSAWLKVGDTLSIEVEVDPSFSPDGYRIEWIVPNDKTEHVDMPSNRLVLAICEHHVNYMFTIYCNVISNESWHRCGDVDDSVGMIYRVLPASP